MTRRRNLSSLAFWAAVMAVLAAGIFMADRAATHFYMSEAASRTQTALRLTTNGLDGHLRRYEALPELLSGHEGIRRLVTDPQNIPHRETMNRWLEATNNILQSADIYVIDMNGNTIAASNYSKPDSFIGRNFIYRPYFTQAAAGGKGRYFALGTTSGVRGYYFAAPIRDDPGTIQGVIAFKIGLDHIEESWRNGEHAIIVSDPEGIIFMASEPGWLYGALLPLIPERTARLAQSRRYAEAKLTPLNQTSYQEQGFSLLSLPDGSQYLQQITTMPDAGWNVHVLMNTAYLRAQARLAVGAAFLLIFAAGFAVILILQRRAIQAQSHAMLERRVEERTADLRATESELRRTQADLVQAGKLAALGQMSAALSHEINQPLAAARNYADNATLLLDRGEPARARENVSHIISLIDRMSVIGKHLRNVARKPDEPLADVDITQTIQAALEIAGPRVSAANTIIELDLPPDMPPVRATAVRLQQVIVNLLSNAADAVEGLPDRRITLSARVEGAHLTLCLRDRGPGVPTAIAERIFDPFFTTKQVGSGLGLGLSISYNIMKDFGGELKTSNHAEGGAVFLLRLELASVIQRAAE
jgi:two-component system C4-dicarboxylate transport sensor histidine kinase DctB